MNVIIYCQHVLGLGHFFRTLEIAKAFSSDEVTLVTGGGSINVNLPDHIKSVCLPGLMMDENFSNLYSVDPQKTVEAVKAQRKTKLLELFKKQKPDVFIVELYPFGRRAFRFELEPVLDFLKNAKQFDCKIVCSIRDILVEKEDASKYEIRVVTALNRWFDAVLVHSDPELIHLDSTFSRIAKIHAPIFYTGFVTPIPRQRKILEIKKNLGLKPKDFLIVVSAGGGSVGEQLLKAAAKAHGMLETPGKVMMKIFTGPYMKDKDKTDIRDLASAGVEVEEFSKDFISLLGAADLSISMAGYNTCMNSVATHVDSLVWPFDQNREQRLRATKISEFSSMTLLEDEDLKPERFSKIIDTHLAKSKLPNHKRKRLNISGALHTEKWIKESLQR